jgi:hypothetical protein
LGSDGGLRAVSVVIAGGAFEPERAWGIASPASCDDGYRFAKWQGKPIGANRRKAP